MTNIIVNTKIFTTFRTVRLNTIVSIVMTRLTIHKNKETVKD